MSFFRKRRTSRTLFLGKKLILNWDNVLYIRVVDQGIEIKYVGGYQIVWKSDPDFSEEDLLWIMERIKGTLTEDAS